MTAVAQRAIRPAAADAELLERVAAGDSSALGALYDRHERDVRRVLARLGGAPEDVDDLLQETFLEVARCASNYDGRPDARPWLIGLSINRLRRQRRSLRALLKTLSGWASEPTPQQPTPEEAAEGARAAELARRALGRLGNKKREVFALVVLEGMTGEQAAAALRIPVATVWTRLHHARRELRAAIEQEEP